jgi:hypothetical protein
VPFPTTSVLDTFDRADGALGANWTTPALGDSFSPYIETNVLRYPNTGQASGCWNGVSAADVEVFYTLTQLNAAGDYAKLLFRCDTASAGSTTAYIVRVVQSSGDWVC